MAAIFKSSLQNLSPLPTSLKVEPLGKPKTGLKFFVNTTKPKTKFSELCDSKTIWRIKALFLGLRICVDKIICQRWKENLNRDLEIVFLNIMILKEVKMILTKSVKSVD